MGLIEWMVVKIGRRGIEARHSEGAQSTFGIGRARKIQHELGAEWQIRNVTEPERGPGPED